MPFTRAKAILAEMCAPEGFSSSAHSTTRPDADLRRRGGGRAAGLLAVAVLLGYALSGCSSVVASSEPDKPTQTSTAVSTASTESRSPAPIRYANGTAAPSWLGARVLPVGPQGSAAAQETPPELRDRSIVTVDDLPPPADGRFHATVQAVPAAVLARSSWTKACPIAAADLRYITVGFRGFDGRAHTGELVVAASAAPSVVRVFRALFRQGFPLEEMRLPTTADLTAPPTGDGNDTAGFVCRAARGQTRFSAHAYGLAIDVNPFQNPYRKGDLVLPELASAYLDRHWVRPGMLEPGSAAVLAFQREGWTWGGTFKGLKDYQHFSLTGG